MITLNHLVRRKQATPLDDFRNYWLGEHAERLLRISADLGIRKLTKCETQHDDDVNKLVQQLYATASDSYDFVDQMVINDLEAFKSGLRKADAADALKAIAESETDWIDCSRSDYWFSIDVPQVFSDGHSAATWENTVLKIFYVPRRHAHLSLQEAQLHWSSCHGAMAREFVEFLPYHRYIQGHRIESRVCQDLKSLLGTEFENIDAMIGQAEAWIDRTAVPALQGPEVERMMGLLVEDIALFVESGISHIFATKEHCILNRPLMTGTVPSLFNAD